MSRGNPDQDPLLDKTKTVIEEDGVFLSRWWRLRSVVVVVVVVVVVDAFIAVRGAVLEVQKPPTRKPPAELRAVSNVGCQECAFVGTAAELKTREEKDEDYSPPRCRRDEEVRR